LVHGENGTSVPIDDECDTAVQDYLGLRTTEQSLESLYKSWAEADGRFASVCVGFPGIRVLRQPPLECVVSFLCSTNNNVKRITMIVERLCASYGDLVATVEDEKYYSFPSLAQLERGDEEAFRALGLGYRCRTQPASTRPPTNRMHFPAEIKTFLFPTGLMYSPYRLFAQCDMLHTGQSTSKGASS